MKKIIKIVVVTLVLLLVALVALPFVFKDKIEAEVKKVVNESVNAEITWSDYGLSLFKSFPEMTVSLDSLKVQGIEEFKEITLANIPSLEVNLDVMSLFGDSAQVNSFSLKDPIINILVTEEGKANYDIAKPSEETDEEVAVTEESGAFNLALKSYEIQNGTLNYLDNTAGMLIYMEELNHTGTGDFTSSIVDLKTETTASEFDFVFDNIPYINQVAADIDLGLKMDLENMRFDIQGNEIFLNDLKLVAEGFVEMPEENIDMDIKYAAPETNIKQLLSMIPSDFTGDLEGVNAKGELALDGFITGTVTETELPEIGLDIKVKDGFIKYPDLPKAIEDLALAAMFTIPQGDNLDEMSVIISELKMNIAGNPIDARMYFAKPFTSQYIDAALNADLDFNKLSQAFPLDDTKLNGKLMADVLMKGNVIDLVNKQFSAFQANGVVDVEGMEVDASDTYKMKIDQAHFDVTPASIKMDSFKGFIGESDFSADGQLDNFLAYVLNGEKLKGAFNFTSDYLNMDDFMTSDEVADSGAMEGESSESEEYIDVPENLDFDLNANIKKLNYDGTEMTDIKGKIGVDDGVAALNDVTLKFLQGTILLDGKYETKNREKPLLDVAYDLKNLDIQSTAENFEIIEQLAPIAKYCVGKFGSKMRFTTELGKDMFPLLETFSGSGNVSTNSVLIEKFKPLNEIAEKLSIDRLAKQTIDNVKMSFYAEDGKVKVDPYEVKLDGMKTVIEGWTDFNAQMDYTAEIQVPFSKLPKQGTQFAADLMNRVNKLGTNFSTNDIIPVQVRITGAMTSPKVSLSNVGQGFVQSAQEQIKEEVKELIDDKVNEVKDDATARARQEAEQIINAARTQAERVRTEGINLADRAKEEAYRAAQGIEDAAKKPWEKLAAQIAADKARKKADETHQKAVNAANAKADKIISDAQKRADGLLGE